MDCHWMYSQRVTYEEFISHGTRQKSATAVTLSVKRAVLTNAMPMAYAESFGGAVWSMTGIGGGCCDYCENTREMLMTFNLDV